MSIKSLDELKKIREEHEGRVNLRRHGETSEGDTEILVGMATCGIASGARETLNELVDELARKNLANVRVIPVMQRLFIRAHR